ncbi:MotA/TolQ/ExbB proton channel family protein [Vibrio sp. SS-MA-C1-2]|uniref:MotA/TolQ/ExbB proton channel family protein n=1 Tax=Vibrio sp. SS-MA-C1-2 TaxID=2908646 RepID=UPI001F3EA6F8|nr:MotA/TolQ/ExbB proton channel family protein [Vibrio sp. SS-MA-C1-2]UJF17334.1 MotA/TolQ/ExbB proton channel family protein [Vibrio sp. SS-MA-C1-2]
MEYFTHITVQLGMMTWPLIAMSTLGLVIILERSLFILMNSRNKGTQLTDELYDRKEVTVDYLKETSQRLLKSRDTFEQGAGMLLSHHEFSKHLREETVSLWLQKKRLKYTSGVKILSIIGVISPLIGLLGTVLGLITMFSSLSDTTGGIQPADLADGLGLAMATTAAGLIIALPAITFAQLFTLWANYTLAKVEHGLNHCNLFLEGVCVEESKIEQKIHCAYRSKSSSYKSANNKPDASELVPEGKLA